MATKKVTNISDTIDRIKNSKEPQDLSEFGREFQVKLIALLIKDRIFSASIVPIIKYEYFSDIYLQKIFVTLKTYIDRFASIPTLDNITILLKEANENMTVFGSILQSIDNMSLEDRDFVMQKARDFCFSRHAKIELEKAMQLIKTGDFEKAQSISSEAFRFSSERQTRILNLKKDYEMVFDEEKAHNPVPMPFPTFNDNMKGGPGSGNLVIMVAESNFGKTNALIAMARHANANKKTTVLFSFEIGGADMLRRHLAGLNDLKQEEVKNNRKAIEIRLSDPELGDFIIIEERATNARISIMKNHLEYLKSTGVFPDMILVDAINQLKPPLGMRFDNDNQKFEYLAEELRDMANDYKLPLYTVMQTNRSGFNNGGINDIQAIGKAIEPFQVADVLITFSQDRPMAAENKCRAMLLKNRLGRKNILLDCYYDPNKCVFDEIGVVDDLLMLNEVEKKQVQATAMSIRDRIRAGDFDGKKKA